MDIGTDPDHPFAMLNRMDESGPWMHPAIAAVLSRLSIDGTGQVMGFVIREEDGAAAVVVHIDQSRYVITILREGDRWLAPGLVFSEALPNPDRMVTNYPGMPLAQQTGDIRSSGDDVSMLVANFPGIPWPQQTDNMRSSGDDEFVWYAIVGTAARDAVSVRVLTTLECCHPVIGDDGLVLALVRAQPGERPLVTVTTRDGREESDYRED